MRPDPRVTRIHSLVRTIADFPKPGVQFRDITPLLADPEGLADTMAVLVDMAPDEVDVVAGIDSRGFLFGAPVAVAMGTGFVPVRKPGKLPGPVFEEAFDLEYGSSTLAIHQDALRPGQRVLLVDDLLATEQHRSRARRWHPRGRREADPAGEGGAHPRGDRH